MFFRCRVVLAVAGLTVLSGCSVFTSDEEIGEEVVADAGLMATNGCDSVSRPADSASPVPETSLPVVDAPSPNFDRRILPVSLIVLHYTAAPLQESLNVLRDGRGRSRVSSHYVVATDGTVFRLVDESNRAWHAGVSRWKGITDVNSASIGIEMVNLGHDRSGHPRPYAAKQVEAVVQLCLDIQSRYDITDVVGHSDVAPDRKIDPGEHFPWKILADRGVNVSARGFVR